MPSISQQNLVLVKHSRALRSYVCGVHTFFFPQHFSLLLRTNSSSLTATDTMFSRMSCQDTLQAAKKGAKLFTILLFCKLLRPQVALRTVHTHFPTRPARCPEANLTMPTHNTSSALFLEELQFIQQKEERLLYSRKNVASLGAHSY